MFRNKKDRAAERVNVRRRGFLERAMGIEPTTTAWEAVVLPLNYARTVYMGYLYIIKDI